MEVYVDGRSFVGDMGGTVGDLLARLRGPDGDRIVVALRFDGQAVEGLAVDQLRAASLAEPGRLELQTDSARRLAARALGEVAEMLGQTHEHHVAIAELLAAGKQAKAMELLTACFTVWNSAEQSLTQASRLVGLRLDGADTSAGEMIDRLRSGLGEIKHALEIRDFVAVADLVEYEMPPVTAGWQKMLAALQQSLLGPSA